MGCYICMGAPVVNYLLNADFAEVTESGMPTSWGTRHWGMWYGSFEIWKQGWCMSKDEKLDGAGVFVLDASRIGNNSVELVSCWNGSPMGQAVFSVYLKSVPAGGRVKLSLGETTKEVTVTEQWQRYWMPVETGGIITVSITGFAGHRISLSKPQLEAGTEPTPFQTRESAGQMAPLHFLAGQNLELPLLTYCGKEPKQPANIRMSADEEGIRVHVVCKLPETQTDGGSKKEKRDELGGCDAICLFLCPEDGELELSWYQFCFDNNGNMRDLKDINPFWDGDWKCESEFIPGKEWRSTVFIPYATLNKGGSRQLASKWRFLVGREYAGEVSFSNPLYLPFYFHNTVKFWGAVENVPVDTINGTGLVIDEPAWDEKGRLAYVIHNERDSQRTLALVSAVASGNAPWKWAEEQLLTLEAKQSFRLSLPAPEEFPASRVVLKENGHVVASRSDNPPHRFPAKPIFQPEQLMVALYCEPHPDEFTVDVLNEIKRLGYNTIISMVTENWGDECMQKLLDRAHKADLKLVIQFFDHKQESIPFIEKVIKRFRSHPALAGWLVVDEPDSWNGFGWAEQNYARIKKLDPEHVAWVNVTAGYKINVPLLGDMRGFDHYAIPSFDPREILSLARCFSQYGDSSFAFLQQTGHAYFYGREPTVAEFRLMLSEALMGGVTAIGTFAQLPVSEALRARMPEVLGRLKADYPIFHGKSFPWKPEYPVHKLLVTEGREVDGKKFVIVLNTSKDAQTIPFKGREIHVSGFDYVILPFE